MNNITHVIGIDPGKKTGLAVWNIKTQSFEAITTLGMIKAMESILVFFKKDEIQIRFEDARLRTWFGNAGREKLQGAGSIKRDGSLWQEFCEYYGIAYEAVKPVAGSTKWKPDYFKKVTGWQGRTSEHSRDAACLVIGIKGG